MLRQGDPCYFLCDFAERCLLGFRLNTGIAFVQARVAEKKNRSRVSADGPRPDLTMSELNFKLELTFVLNDYIHYRKCHKKLI